MHASKNSINAINGTLNEEEIDDQNIFSQAGRQAGKGDTIIFNSKRRAMKCYDDPNKEKKYDAWAIVLYLLKPYCLFR